MSQPPQGPNPYQAPQGPGEQPLQAPPQRDQPPAPTWNQPGYPNPPQPPYPGAPAAYPGAPGQLPYPGAGQYPQPGVPPYPGAGQYPQPGVGYGVPPYYQVPVPPKAKRGKGLGIAGLAMVLIGAGVGIWGAWMFGESAGEMFIRLGVPLTQLEQFDPEMLPDSELTAISIVMMPALVASLVGFVGWIMCIVAAVRDSARPVAIVGIVLGVIAPIVQYFAMAGGLAAGMGLMVP